MSCSGLILRALLADCMAGSRGCIDDMGVPKTAIVSAAMATQKAKMITLKDQSLWKQSNDKFKPAFKTKLTWELTRKQAHPLQWPKGVWFQHSIPKLAFFHWLT